jgi:hypothetical protein
MFRGLFVMFRSFVVAHRNILFRGEILRRPGVAGPAR